MLSRRCHAADAMGEFIARTNIARRKNAGICRPQPRVHRDSLLVVRDTDCVQPDALDVWSATDPDQNLVDRHLVLLAMGLDREPFDGLLGCKTENS